MITETVAGTQLSTYGLRLSRLDGHIDLPPNKQILDEHDYSAKMCTKQEKVVTARLVGVYASPAEMATAITNLKTKIASGVTLNWKFDNHGFNESCIAKDGLQTTITGKSAATVIIKLTITE